MTSELFSSVYKEKSDHLFDDRIFSCPVPAFTHWSIFVPLSENPWSFRLFYGAASQMCLHFCPFRAKINVATSICTGGSKCPPDTCMYGLQICGSTRWPPMAADAAILLRYPASSSAPIRLLICRPLPLAQVASPATGGAPIAPRFAVPCVRLGAGAPALHTDRCTTAGSAASATGSAEPPGQIFTGFAVQICSSK